MYIHTAVSVSVVLVVALVAISIDYDNYLDTKSNICTESVKIIETVSGEIRCKNGHYEVFKLDKAGHFMAHCSCPHKEQSVQAADDQIDLTHPDQVPMLKAKPNSFGSVNTDKLF
jgi:hypothetical protein